MAKIDWHYHRNGCKTCEKAQGFLENAGITAKETVNARKDSMRAEQAVQFARSFSKIIATKGNKVITLDLKKETATDDDIRRLVVGPSGNLRAPAIRKGSTLIVGYDEETFESQFS